MAKDLISGLILTPSHKEIFSWVLPLLVVRNCSKLSSYAISTKTTEPNFRRWQKKLILGPILASLTQIWAAKFFFVDFTSASIYILFQAIILCNLKENLLTKLAKMAKNLILGPTAAQIWTPNFFFVSFTCIRFKTLLQDTTVWNFKETNEPNLKMAKKT